MAREHFAVNWKDHMDHLKVSMDQMLQCEEFTDVTVFVDGKVIRAHKMILGACSLYFNNVFKQIKHENPVVIIKGIEYSVLIDIFRFMYQGQVSIDSEMFESFIEAAKTLQVCGLTGDDIEEDFSVSEKVETINVENNKRSLEEDESDINQKQKVYCPELKNEPIVLLEDILDEVLIDEDKLKENQMDTTPVSKNLAQISKLDETSGNDKSHCKDHGDYKCKICGKKYRLKDSLYKHLGMHNGTTTCSICNKILSRKTHLQRHMIVAHGHKREKDKKT